jgi:hypothetical protein
MRSKKRSFGNRCFASTTWELGSLVFECLATDLSLRLRSDLKHPTFHERLARTEIDPSTYDDCELFRRDYLAVSLFSKYPYLLMDCDRQAVAIEKFTQAESLCSATNLRLTTEVPGSIYSHRTPLSVFELAKLKIRSLLGPFNWNEAEQHFGFGPGASVHLSRRKGDAYFKYGDSHPTTTKAALDLGLVAVKRVPAWYSFLTSETILDNPEGEDLFGVVPGNKVVTVPKSALTDRVIAIEPSLNMFLQKGIGGIIRGRLKRVSIDLDDQSRNQSLAAIGSLDNSLATIDLSSASDSVSLELVRYLMPSDWVSAIEQTRSPRGTLPDGGLISYQKVSSMGNGFTFELESLLFWALAQSVIELFSVQDRRLAVYGDDIICSSFAAGPLIWILEFAGFTVNKKKTFVNGPFRESCGKHFFRGVDVTPFYLRDKVESQDRLIWFANSVRRWSRLSYGLDPLLKPVYDFTVSLLPKGRRKPGIPDGYGDIALIGDFDECKPQWSKRYQAWLGRGYTNIKRNLNPDGVGRLLRSLDQLEKSKQPTWRGDGFPSGNHHYRVSVKIPVTQWDSHGPWL